ncbi:superoxide dismutase [Desulfofundulus salinus]|uniref:superoxide dismutase n=1 Tax=Desulfofundulus salinus TaxID=2419843 RepID=UPI001FAACAB8|nr:superoxide dismutase [Desulfofundulus salinum]
MDGQVTGRYASKRHLQEEHMAGDRQIVHVGDMDYPPSGGAFTPVRAKPLPPELLRLRGISARTIQEHYKLYDGYVNKTNEIRNRLRTVDRASANSTYSPLRELKVEESYATNGVKLHELYFGNLGGPGGRPTGALYEAIVFSYGSYEFWENDFKASGLASRGWVILSYDQDDGFLHNYSADAHNVGIFVRTQPILVLDVYEHAYYIDYGTDRRSYIEAFFQNINWAAAGARFQALQGR